MRIDLRATLDGARLSLQIDIGFGDAVTPAAQSIAYPTAPGKGLPPWMRAIAPCRLQLMHQNGAFAPKVPVCARRYEAAVAPSR